MGIIATKERDKRWIQTRHGRKFFPLDPDPEEIDPKDVGAALSKICRFTGHVSRFYSVAEHSVRVSKRAEVLAAAKGYSGSRVMEIARWGLMHDASEAYIADIASPVKHQAVFDQYRLAEANLMRAVAVRFDLPGDEPEEVRYADAEMLGVEVRQLMTPQHSDWDLSQLPPPPLDVPVLGWNPDEAEMRFGVRFRLLFNEKRLETK